jgi:HK97 family phage major capsid protein
MAARIHALRQQEADLKNEARAILDTAAAEGNRALAANEGARCDAIEASLDALKPELARELRFQDAERNAPTGRVEVGSDHAAERPWGPRLPENASLEVKTQVRQAGLGEFAIAVKNAMTGQGADPRLFAAATGMGTAVPSEGGFAVPIEIAAGIERDMFAGGELLSRVDARTISSDNMAYTVIDETSRASTRNGGVLGYWVDQGTAPTASQFKLARVELKLRKVGALGYMTDELISDAAALGGELESMFGDELIFQVEDAITEGTGAAQPLGYLNAPCLVSVDKETNQTASTINTANLSKMWARMPARSKPGAVWLINGDAGPQLDALSIPAGTGALEPRFVNYSPTGILTIKGRPVVETEYNATLGTVGDIVLIDLKKYRLIRKGGVEQASSIHVMFTTGQTTFRAFYRCDGQMMPRSAVTPFKGGSTKTLSPVVVLATRS